MSNTESSALKEQNDLTEFQTKASFKVGGSDGKSQFTFMQLAEKKQMDSVVSQKGYTLEEVLN
jgi:hypothetical protein